MLVPSAAKLDLLLIVFITQFAFAIAHGELLARQGTWSADMALQGPRLTMPCSWDGWRRTCHGRELLAALLRRGTRNAETLKMPPLRRHVHDCGGLRASGQICAEAPRVRKRTALRNPSKLEEKRVGRRCG